jgi:hypothetical protein
MHLAFGRVTMHGTASQRANPCEEWLSPVAWDGICELDVKHEAFSGLASSFEQARQC